MHACTHSYIHLHINIYMPNASGISVNRQLDQDLSCEMTIWSQQPGIDMHSQSTLVFRQF